ncbi:hypothetical protein KSP40_PGU017714 [Platanthera guangdongensis]|uniref:Uncharacterized protein n=1 Tax=Platanthera guangdongensis TaxID=2320717 RepID=A0ABR2LY37_9ASPA
MDGTQSSGFSWAAGGAPNTAKRAALFQPLHRTSGCAVSRADRLLSRKDNSSRGPHQRL